MSLEGTTALLRRDWTALLGTENPGNGKPWLGADGIPRVGASVGHVATAQELTDAIATREPSITAGTTEEYIRGDKSLAPLNQAAVAGLTTTDIPTFAGVTSLAGDTRWYSDGGNTYIRRFANNGPLRLHNHNTISFGVATSLANAIAFVNNASATDLMVRKGTGSDYVNIWCQNLMLRGGVIEPTLTNSIEQRNGTTGQKARWAKTWTSTSNHEMLEIDAAALDGATPVYRIGSRVGSIGGTNRDIQIGHWDAAEDFTPRFTVSSNNPYVSLNVSGSSGQIAILRDGVKRAHFDLNGNQLRVISSLGVTLSSSSGLIQLQPAATGGNSAVWVDDSAERKVAIGSHTYATNATAKLSVEGTVSFDGIPTSDPATAGQLWNDGGTLKISAG